MDGKTGALLIGDNANAKWHPLEPAKKQLAAILGEEFQITATEDYGRLSKLEQERFPLCISYTDCWNRELPLVQIGGLLRYVAEGGGLLVIHNGISLQCSPELLQMIGARFTGHPPYQSLNYLKSTAGHPILEGIGNFTMDEEPYMFDFDPFSANTVFLDFEFAGKRHPAAWERRYGLGKVVYLQPGHHAPSFDSPSVQRLILNSARWATR